jgi:hypothetical protein
MTCMAWKMDSSNMKGPFGVGSPGMGKQGE